MLPNSQLAGDSCEPDQCLLPGVSSDRLLASCAAARHVGCLRGFCWGVLRHTSAHTGPRGSTGLCGGQCCTGTCERDDTGAYHCCAHLPLMRSPSLLPNLTPHVGDAWWCMSCPCQPCNAGLHLVGGTHSPCRLIGPERSRGNHTPEASSISCRSASHDRFMSVSY